MDHFFSGYGSVVMGFSDHIADPGRKRGSFFTQTNGDWSSFGSWRNGRLFGFLRLLLILKVQLPEF